MQTTMRRHYAFDPDLFRWLARASAVVLVAAWLALVIREALISHFEAPSVSTYYQAAALAIVFAGYAIGWRTELAGGLIAILGTLAFYAVHIQTLGNLPNIAVAWFAAPGILFLAAWLSQKVNRHAS